MKYFEVNCKFYSYFNLILNGVYDYVPGHVSRAV
jgi:hypothetical protein